MKYSLPTRPEWTMDRPLNNSPATPSGPRTGSGERRAGAGCGCRTTTLSHPAVKSGIHTVVISKFPLTSTEVQNNFKHITRARGGKGFHRTVQAVAAADQRPEIDLP